MRLLLRPEQDVGLVQVIRHRRSRLWSQRRRPTSRVLGADLTHTGCTLVAFGTDPLSGKKLYTPAIEIAAERRE